MIYVNHSSASLPKNIGHEAAVNPGILALNLEEW